VGCTVFAESMGFFHKGSGGKGVAPGDACLSPPPPPAGPLPVPYVNMLQASDLAKGSKSVKIQGEPTALEDASEISTSSGNEAGTQGGGVVTHKTKGKGSFKSWCFSVKVEGKGVACHGNMMIQNTASDPPNCIDAAAMTTFKVLVGDKAKDPCPPYDRDKHAPAITADQDDEVAGETCWECQSQQDAGETPLTVNPDDASDFGNWLRNEAEYESRSGGKYSDRDREAMTPDHQPPLCVAWALGGCHLEPTDGDPTGFQQEMAKRERVKPHCRRHSNSQGSQAAAYARRILSARG
jgi:Domain of unknown function (DUF4150)